MRSALFRDVTQRRVVIPYRRFGTTYRFHRQGQEIQEETILYYGMCFTQYPLLACKSTEQSTPS